MIVRVLAASLMLLNVAAAEPKGLAPTGKWVVNFADAQCIATRNYGSDQNPLFLVFKAPPTGNTLQIGIIRNGSNSPAKQLDGEIVFGDAAPIRSTLIAFGAKKTGQRVLLANIPTSELGALPTATTLRIRARGNGITTTASRVAIGGGGGADESFAISQMSSLLKVLDDCTADLRKVWHVWSDEGRSPNLKEGARANLTRIFDPDDYPEIAQFNDQMGTVGLVLLVDEQGTVADCTTVETSGVAALDAQSCAILKERARFQPAIGLDGKPAKSSFHQRITWRLEG